MTTIVICTVSAAHFDLPDNNAHRLSVLKRMRSRDFWREVWSKLVTYAIVFIAPEYFVWRSCGEYYSAVRDCAYVKSKFEGWTVKHSFFAAMKGFTLEGSDEPRTGRDLLAKGAKLDNNVCDRIGYEISDKSKADVLAKLLAVIQLTRFLLETFARALSSLPITSLEFFTCQHVVCTLMVYIFWLEKPRGVQEKISLEKCEPMDAGNPELILHGTSLFSN